MPKITKLDDNKYSIEFGTLPNGATNLLIDNEKPKSIKSTHIFDMKLVNPDVVDIPNAMIEPFFKSEIINAQRSLRSECNAGDFEQLKIVLSTEHTFLCGEKTTRKPAKSTANIIKDTFNELRKLTNNKITRDELYDYLELPTDDEKLQYKQKIIKKYK